MRTSPLLATFSFLAACAPVVASPGGTGDGAGGKADDGSDGRLLPSVFDDPERFVLRNRLEYGARPPGGAGERLVRMTAQPFSHRAGKWHVYPFTMYEETTFDVAVTLLDDAMRGRAGAWLYGPRRSDGTWGEPRALSFDDGVARVRAGAQGYGHYAVVVGALLDRETGAGRWLPRYPAARGDFEAGDADDDTDASVTMRAVVADNEAYLELDATADDADIVEEAARAGIEPGVRYAILDPLPDPEADLEWGTEFTVRSPGGDELVLTLDAWLPQLWVVPDLVRDAAEATGVRPGREQDGVLALLNMPNAGEVDLYEEGDWRSYYVLHAFSARGEHVDVETAQPRSFIAVAQTLDDGRDTEVIDDPACDRADDAVGCLPVAVYYDRAGDYYVTDAGGSEIAVREEVRVPDDRLRSFRSLFIDGDETSTYDVSLTCEGERCGPPAHIAPTRYPIYFAHGFNSSAASWDGLRRLLHDSHGWPSGWTEAGDVPGFEPVERRAEILREHLTRWLGRFRPPAGEPFMRINVVAHSMGGLDARYLLAAPEYNEGCDAASGRTPSGKCMLDEEGRVIHWRDRIASITTLSTPHCGSTFASWGLEKLHRSRGGFGILDWTFRTASRRVLGGEPQTVEATLEALSVEYHLDESEPTDFNVMCAGRRLPFDARRTLGRHALVDPDALHARARHYDFSRATTDAGYLSGLGIPPEHRPEGDRLPGPFIERGGRQVPISGTVFAWAGVTCLDGSCGNVVDVALAVPHGIESDNAPHTPNDGVVTVESARFGIYMGTRSNDHFHWSPYEEGHVSRAWRWLAGGHESEPVEGFHLWWASRLSAAGY